MFTDPRRLRRTDPGVAKECGVFMLHNIFTDQQTCNEIESSCANASIGCTDCKKILNKNLNENIRESSKIASQAAKETLNIAKEAIFNNYL